MTPVRNRARRGEGDRLRGEILAVAEDLLTDTADASAVSIRAIADRVGVTPPSIYRHFSDKEELLDAVCENVFTRLDQALEDAAAAASDPLDELMRKGHAYVEFGLAFPEHYRLVFMRQDPALQHGPPLEPAAVDDPLAGVALTGSNAFGHLVDTVERVVALLPAELRPDAFALACSVWTAVHGITSLRIAKCDFPWPPLETQLELIAGPWRERATARSSAAGRRNAAGPSRQRQ